MSIRLVPRNKINAKCVLVATQWALAHPWATYVLYGVTAVAWVLNHLPKTTIRERPAVLELARLVSLLLVLKLIP